MLKNLSSNSFILVVIFLFVLITHYLSPVAMLTDMAWSTRIAMSILKEGNANLDEYERLISTYDYRVEKIEGHLYTRYPIGVPLVAVPFVFIADKLSFYLFEIEDLADYLSRYPADWGITRQIEKFTASFIVALTTIFIYLIASLALTKNRSILLALIFAFCTAAWSTASRGLWQHGPSMLMLSITLYLILISKKHPFYIQFTGAILGFAYVIRPTNSLSIIILTILMLVHYRKYILHYFCWAATIAIPFMYFNYSIYQSILPWYYMQKTFSTHTFVEALIGHLFSPSRGLFIFSPILLLIIYSIFIKVKSRKWQSLDYYLITIIGLHLLIMSFWPIWWGGHSTGPRMLSDMLPYLMYFFISFLAINKFRVINPLNMIFWGFALFGFLANYHCATDVAIYNWNRYPNNVDLNPARLWDWSDPQFLRGLSLQAAKVELAPSYIYIAHHQNSSSEITMNVVLRNKSEHELTWEGNAPNAIKKVDSNKNLAFYIDKHGYKTLRNEVAGFSSQTVKLTIDTNQYDVGIHSLGGIAINIYYADGTPIKNSLTVIPVTLEVKPLSLPTASSTIPRIKGNDLHQVFIPMVTSSISFSQDFVPPPDILLNSLPQSGPIQIIHGLGWQTYAEKTRQVQLPATIYINSPREQIVQFKAKLPTSSPAIQALQLNQTFPLSQQKNYLVTSNNISIRIVAKQLASE